MVTVKEGKKMTTYDAVMIAEGVYPGDTDQMQEAWQILVDTGLAWSMQDWFGREATRLIEAGVIQPFPRP
jgi:hypothetical protein